MYLRPTRRLKDGKEHRYWSIVESKRCAGGKVVQRQVLYLGEINDSQEEAWCRVIEAFDEEARQPTQLALFPADRPLPEHRGLRRAGTARGHATTPAAAMGRVLARLPAVRATGARRVLGGAAARFARRDLLAARAADAGVLPADRSGQRVAAAPAVVRAQRHRRSAGEDSARQDNGCIAAWTSCWRTRRRSSSICADGGRICSAPGSTCCSTI